VIVTGYADVAAEAGSETLIPKTIPPIHNRLISKVIRFFMVPPLTWVKGGSKQERPSLKELMQRSVTGSINLPHTQKMKR
jgi:hypothetical protein